MTIEIVGTRINDPDGKEPSGSFPFFYARTENPSWNADVDLFVIPVGMIAELDSVPGLDAPVFAYGKAESLEYAFASGCMDYLREPWTREELESRARARFLIALRGVSGRVQATPDGLSGPGGKVPLTTGEWKTLRLLLANRTNSVPRDAIARLLGAATETGSRAVEMTISRLRRKLRTAAGSPSWRAIRCGRKRGYRLVEQVVDNF
ncbi:MAG: helix-turn-helix domain-containing protein [Spirochaetes bacterium]|nr:helix-turn-helix domain-containing protein [Spirochaetota bacterium]